MNNLPATAPTGALAIREDQSDWSPEQRAALAQIGVADAPQADQLVFLNQAQRTGLDPFTRQLYMIGRQASKNVNGQWVKEMKYTIQASIDGLRVVAQRSGQYAGQLGPFWCDTDGVWVDVWLKDYPPAAAKVGILRHGFSEPVWGVARFSSYAATKRDGGLTGQWPTMPDVMIAKCAEALALRKAFPQDLSGIYTAEEMAQADNNGPAVRSTPTPAPVAMVPVTRAKQAVWVATGNSVEDSKRYWEESGFPTETHLSVPQADLQALLARITVEVAEAADVVEGEFVEDAPAAPAATDLFDGSGLPPVNVTGYVPASEGIDPYAGGDAA